MEKERQVDSSSNVNQNMEGEGPSSAVTAEDAFKFKEIFDLLWPDSQGVVHKNKLLDFFQNILGTLYNEETVESLIEIMQPDDKGFVNFGQFAKSLSKTFWTPESVTAMHQILTSDKVSDQLANWKGVLINLGLEMTDEEAEAIVKSAHEKAVDLVSNEIENVKLNEGNYDKCREILNSIRSKIGELDGDLSDSEKCPICRHEEDEGESEDKSSAKASEKANLSDTLPQ